MALWSCKNKVWSLFVTFLMLISILAAATAGNTKIAYKKSLYGKANVVNEKYLKLKQESEKKASAEAALKSSTTTLSIIMQDMQANETTTTATIQLKDSSKELVSASQLQVPEDIVETTTTTTITTTSTIKPTVLEIPKTRTATSNLPAPCSCGIFLTSQIQRGQAQGAPVILYELDRSFACNIIGQKQCQTKCLEKIVQHLPNAANILCATLDRDCRKERAFLFIKNCQHKWWNTSLAAGREYCCKNGQPYPCPLI